MEVPADCDLEGFSVKIGAADEIYSRYSFPKRM
jgi:hypothetical protein